MKSSVPSGIWRDIVARASSASKPSARTAGMFMAVRISSRWSSWTFSSSGIDERWALYSGKTSILNCGFPLSHTTDPDLLLRIKQLEDHARKAVEGVGGSR
jgi:hypothetical protein